METTATTTTATSAPPKPMRAPTPMNGVNTPTLLATVNAVRQEPALARFTFRATNAWQQGTHSRTRIETFDGAGATHAHQKPFAYDADHAVDRGALGGDTVSTHTLVRGGAGASRSRS